MQGQDRNDEQQKGGRINGLEVHQDLGIWGADFQLGRQWWWESGMSEIMIGQSWH